MLSRPVRCLWGWVLVNSRSLGAFGQRPVSPPRPFLWLCVSTPPRLCKVGAGSSGLGQVWQADWAALGPQGWAGVSERGAGGLGLSPAATPA